MLIAILAVLGICAGSFINAFVWRLHEGKDWIRGRSECPNCGHALAARDLLPIVSWLALKGRCRYCQAPIARHYPAIELLAAVWFAGSYVFWPLSLSVPGQTLLFVSWLVVSVGLIALLLYDHLWMILPNKIIYGSLLVAASARLAYILHWAPNITHELIAWALSVLVASGLFFILHEVSRGQWIGFGDVRLGYITGTVLASPVKSALMIFIASLIGTMAALPSLFKKRKTLNERLPYGPFLIIAAATVLLFGQSLIDWYKQLYIH